METGYGELQVLLEKISPRRLLSVRGKFVVIIPSLLSLARVFLGAAIYATANQPLLLQGLIHFVAGLSDAYDGMLARYWKCTSRIGAVLDPLCDKIYLFWCTAAYWNRMDHIAFGFVVGFEAFLLALQIFGFLIALARGLKVEDEDLKSHIWGKSKFGLQCAAIASALCGLRNPAIVLAAAAFVAGVGSIVEFKLKRDSRKAAHTLGT